MERIVILAEVEDGARLLRLVTRKFGHWGEGTRATLVHESCFGGAGALVPAKFERGDVGVMVVDRSSIKHPDLSLTRPRLRFEEVNVQGREGAKNLERERGGDG